jgi:hypothetical protein
MAVPGIDAVERTGPGVRAAIVAHAPDLLERFEAEFRSALRVAHDDLDLAPAESVVDRWWRVVQMRSSPLSPSEEAAIERARHGDESQLWSRTSEGWERP